MKAILRRIWMVLTWPFRMLAAGFRAVGRGWKRFTGFFTDVPEEVSLTDTVGEALSGREGFFGILSGLGEHIDALRLHLLRSVIAMAITTSISFLFAQNLMSLLAAPLDRVATVEATGQADATPVPGSGLRLLQVIEPTEAVGVYMRVSLLSGLVFAMPWIILEIFLFIAPGLMPRARLTLLLAIPAASLLFVLGIAFTYYVMLPAAIPFLFNFAAFRAAWRPSAYFGLVTTLMFWVGISFQMPMIIYALASVGLIKARQLATQWKIALVVITILAAMITPTVDPVNQVLVMAPMVALYGLSIVGAMVAELTRRRGLSAGPPARPMDTTLLHLIAAADYAAGSGQAAVVACPPGGFIHLTQGAEVLVQVANTFLRSAPGAFLALEVDPARLTAELRWEPPDPPAAPGTAMYGKLFHTYGPLNREAVVGVRPAVRAADGTFLKT